MSLANWTRLGTYEILAPIGAVVMGELCRARDARLGREVAVKALPAEFAGDAERLWRFEQNARARDECPKYLEKPLDDLIRQLDREKIAP